MAEAFRGGAEEKKYFGEIFQFANKVLRMQSRGKIPSNLELDIDRIVDSKKDVRLYADCYSVGDESRFYVFDTEHPTLAECEEAFLEVLKVDKNKNFRGAFTLIIPI